MRMSKLMIVVKMLIPTPRFLSVRLPAMTATEVLRI
jgi:hypothetical protein